MTSRVRVLQIDLIKGAAILSVIALHGLSAEALHTVWAPLNVGQAVPVFLVTMALNGAGSLHRRGTVDLRARYSRSYLAGRVERLFVPFAVVWLLGVAVGLVHGGLHFGPLMLTGVLPIAGPGTYFVTIAFEFVLVFPALAWAFDRAPRGTVALCFLGDLVFELLAPHVGALAGSDPYAYDAAILRYAGQIALGLWIASHPRLGDRANRWILFLAPLSLAYLVTEQLVPSAFPWLRHDFGTSTNLFSAFFPALLVLAGMRVLPGRAGRLPLRALAAVGRASWHIFLIQTMWFAVDRTRGWTVLPLHAAVCTGIGYALYVLLGSAPVGPALRRVGLRAGAHPSPAPSADGRAR